MRRLGKRAVSANLRYPACLFNILVSEKEEGEGEEEDGVLMVGCVSGNLEINIELERDSIGILNQKTAISTEGFLQGLRAEEWRLVSMHTYIYTHTQAIHIRAMFQILF